MPSSDHTALPAVIPAETPAGKPALPTPDAEAICRLLASHQFNIQDEKSLQDGIATVLTARGLPFQRELALDKRNRPDFLLGTLGVEVKTKDSFARFMRQANRYLEKPEVSALIVVGTPKWMPMVPGTLLGKPLYTVRLVASLL